MLDMAVILLSTVSSKATQSLLTTSAAVVGLVQWLVSHVNGQLVSRSLKSHCSEIKNPISLARTVLELSTQELTLRRVPPNLLLGQGATDFAFEQGMAVLPHDALVSPAAKERYNRWKVDLRNAEKRELASRVKVGVEL